MKNYDATDEMVEWVNCAVCDNEIRGGKWFSRIAAQKIMVALCCPLCHTTFVKNPVPYVRRIDTYAIGRKGKLQ